MNSEDTRIELKVKRIFKVISVLYLFIAKIFIDYGPAVYAGGRLSNEIVLYHVIFRYDVIIRLDIGFWFNDVTGYTDMYHAFFGRALGDPIVQFLKSFNKSRLNFFLF